MSKVFWSVKFAKERMRIINSYLRGNEVLCDMFCGVGPLSIKGAAVVKDLRVVCNDLNPNAIKYC